MDNSTESEPMEVDIILHTPNTPESTHNHKSGGGYSDWESMMRYSTLKRASESRYSDAPPPKKRCLSSRDSCYNYCPAAASSVSKPISLITTAGENPTYFTPPVALIPSASRQEPLPTSSRHPDHVSNMGHENPMSMMYEQYTPINPRLRTRELKQKRMEASKAHSRRGSNNGQDGQYGQHGQYGHLKRKREKKCLSVNFEDMD